jgi:hypothetical protein
MKKQSMKKIATKVIKPISSKGDSTKLKSVTIPKGKAPTKVKQTLKDRIAKESFGIGGTGLVLGVAAYNRIKDLKER